MLKFYKIDGLLDKKFNQGLDLSHSLKNTSNKLLVQNNLLVSASLKNDLEMHANKVIESIFLSKKLLFNQDINLFKEVFDLFNQPYDSPIWFEIIFIDSSENECWIKFCISSKGILSENFDVKFAGSSEFVNILWRNEEGYFEIDLEKSLANVSLVPLNYVDKENSAFYTIEQFVRLKSIIRLTYNEFDRLYLLDINKLKEFNLVDEILKMKSILLEHKKTILRILKMLDISVNEYDFVGDRFHGINDIRLKISNTKQSLTQTPTDLLESIYLVLLVLRLTLEQRIILLINIDKIYNPKIADFILTFFQESKWNITGTQLIFAR